MSEEVEFQLPEAKEHGQVYFHDGVCYVAKLHEPTGHVQWTVAQ